MAPASLRIIPNWSFRDVVYRLLDAGSILAGLCLAGWWTHCTGSEPLTLVGGAALLVFGLLAEANGMYRSWRGVSAEQELLCVLLTWLLTIPTLLTLGYLAGYLDQLPRGFNLIWASAAPCLSIGGRVALRGVARVLRGRGFNTRRFAIVGVNELGFRLARNIECSPETGLKLVGFYDDRPQHRLPPVPDDVGHCIGPIDQLVQQTRQREVDCIYITFPMRAEARIRGILRKLGDTTASVYIVPDFFVFEMLHSRWTSIGGLPVVSVFESPLYGIDGLLKRGMDFLLASLLVVLLALPMACIALAVKLTSPGPVFFRQRRYGLDGREIRVWKFRSMRVCEDGGKVTQATQNDTRVTPLGNFLRKTSLDELPQLFNVLEGSMSLVGPRPHASTHNESYRKVIQGYMLRHKVRPGITGLAQVNGLRGETDTLEKMQRRVACDHQYIREWSLWLDLKILFKTLFVVLSRQNAY